VSYTGGGGNDIVLTVLAPVHEQFAAVPPGHRRGRWAG
jgi:hypothetical protein